MSTHALCHDRALIREVMAHRLPGGERHLSQMETAGIYHAVGLRYGDAALSERLSQLSRDKLDMLLERLAAPIAFMQAHPTKACPCCGNVVDAASPHPAQA